MTFGELLYHYIREQKVSINALAQELGYNRGTFYKIFTSAQSLPAELLPVVLNRLSLTVFQQKELTDAFFSEQFGVEAHRDVLLFLEKWQRFDTDCLSPHPENSIFGKIFPNEGGTLENAAVIRSAVSFIFDSQPETVITNFPAQDVLLHQMLLYAVSQKKVQRLRRIVNFHDGNVVDLFFQIIHLLYQYALATEGTDRQNEISNLLYETETDAGLLYPYFLVSERYAVLFGGDGGLFLSDPEQVRHVFARAGEAINASVGIRIYRNDVMSVSNDYGAAIKEVSVVAINKTVPLFVDYSKEMFNDLAREELPNRGYYIDFAAEYYRNLLSRWSINDFISLAGLDDFCATGRTRWMPEYYAKNLSMPRRIIYPEKLLAQIREDHIHFLDQRKLLVPNNINLELWGDNLSVYGVNPALPFPSFYDMFVLTLNGNPINGTLRLVGEYLKNAGTALSGEAALAEVQKRLAGLRAMLQCE